MSTEPSGSEASTPGGPQRLVLPRGEIVVPAFLPDATRGVVRGVDSADLAMSGVSALVMNTYHLMQRPGTSTVRVLGGLHQLAGWDGPIVTDSGGFQIYSLIRQNPKLGTLTNAGARFRPEGAAREFQLTPEKTVQLQLGFRSDIVICLDDCTHVTDPFEQQRDSVRRTLDWARRGKREFDRLIDQRRPDGRPRPSIFAVVQGGGSRELRRECAEGLLDIGFDGFGFGGWPLDEHGELLTEILAFTRDLIPRHLPMHALGVGHPANVVAGIRLGYQLFDSALPTRDARRGRLYAFSGQPSEARDPTRRTWFDTVYVLDDKHTKVAGPISPVCSCYTCRTYSLAYLRHLFKIEDSLALRLATIHNLRFMSSLVEQFREQDS